MPKFIAALIRHADYQQLPDTPSAHQPFALSKKGQEQSRLAGIALRDVIRENQWNLVNEVDSSQQLRAWQTAQLICEQLADHNTDTICITGYDDLAERGLGSANNLSMQQIEAVINEDPRFPSLPSNWKTNSKFCLPLQGAESLMQAGQRVASHLIQQMSRLANSTHSDSLKLFIGHGGAFRHAAYLLGVLDYEQIAALSMYHAQPVFLQYHNETSWQHIAGNWKIRNTSDKHID
jgi:2,3-bisphosphoglycerate-dependent phosphoglycerate mutase